VAKKEDEDGRRLIRTGVQACLTRVCFQLFEAFNLPFILFDFINIT
jgi:hypothetical protein